MNTVRHVRLFRNGRNQALRIPRDLELPAVQRPCERRVPRLIVEPLAGPSLLAVLAKLEPLEEEFPQISRPAPNRLKSDVAGLYLLDTTRSASPTISRSSSASP